MKKLLLLLTLIVSFDCYSQISFEKGYYITNADQKIDGFIKNVDWKNNPTSIEFKPSENGEQEVLAIESIKEFAIDNASKYTRYRVKIDRSSDLVSELSTDKTPIMKEEQLFLKVLVEGKANLFLYEDKNTVRYFYGKDTAAIEQLIYKRFLTPERKIGVNKTFTQQLWNDLKCPDISFSNVENINYKKKELVDFFIKYNECNKSISTNFEAEKKGDLFNLTVRPGINIASFTAENSFEPGRNTDFGTSMGFRFGIEAEFILPFNNNKWALIAEPSFQYFKSEGSSATVEAKADYKAIELPLGVRHYFFLDDNAKIFINGLFVMDLSSKTLIDFNPGADLESKTTDTFAVGLGYVHNNKYSVELRYQTSRNLLYEYLYWTSDYQTISVILGYTIF